MGVRIQGRYGYATSSDMHRELGVTKLPDEGMPVREVQGVQVYVKPRTIGSLKPHRCAHRVFAICTCGRHVPVGRLHQHICKGAR